MYHKNIEPAELAGSTMAMDADGHMKRKWGEKARGHMADVSQPCELRRMTATP
jgi:hypothetical protein